MIPEWGLPAIAWRMRLIEHRLGVQEPVEVSEAMSGGYISCGSFHGEDKSGSAYSGVLEALLTLQSGRFASIVSPLQEDLSQCDEYVEIPPSVAAELLVAVSACRQQLEVEIGGPRDPFEVMAQDQDRGLDAVEAKWGKGTGWRYYCALDLQRALGSSVSTGEPVYIIFD